MTNDQDKMLTKAITQNWTIRVKQHRPLFILDTLLPGNVTHDTYGQQEVEKQPKTVSDGFMRHLQKTQIPFLLFRLAVVCCTLCISVTALQHHSSYRLVIGDGGYARILKPAPSLTDLTLAAWVNITQFPYGVAPILTAVSPEADSQVAFFLRHDGLGVLWGGPLPVQPYETDHVDRHPRTQWTQKEQPHQKRQRRDAVDYSVGLGDIENIMADSRKGRSFDTWTPYSFVDVDTMGVADLEASPSGLNDNLHLLKTRDGFSRSESYNDWTVVPYELTMQESDPYDLHLKESEPRIITEPSGDDDFVLFNWNVPPPPKPSIPQSPNEWSPMWHNDQESKGVADQEETKHTSTEKIDRANNVRWSSQVTEVKLGPNHWNPYGIRGTTFTSQRPKQQPPITTTLRPTTTTHRKPTAWPARTTTPWPTSKPSESRLSVQRLTTSQSTLRWRATQPPTTPTPPPSPAIHHDRHELKSSTQNILRGTTTRRPHSGEQNKPRQTPSISRQSTRMPLWKLINQPNSQQPSLSHHKNETTTLPPTTTTAAPQTTPTTTTTTKTTVTTTPKQIIRTTTRKSLPQTTTIRTTTSRPRPVSVIRFTSSQREPTEKPQVTGLKSKVSVWSTAEDVFKNKEQNHHEKWSDKSYGTANTVNKHKAVQIRPQHIEEFKRAMEGQPAIKDGNTAVVYSVPITNVDAFNAMYEHYQAQSAPEPPKTTKAPFILKDETFVVHEEETNENQLGENNLHFTDSLPYEFPNGPEDVFEETVAPAIITEEKAVLIPTEEPLPPTPSRSDIPIKEEEEEEESSPSRPTSDKPIVQYVPPITKHEDVLEEAATNYSPSVIKLTEENSQHFHKQPIVIVAKEQDNWDAHEVTSEIPATVTSKTTLTPEITTKIYKQNVVTSTLPGVSEPATAETSLRNSGYKPTIPPIINFSADTVGTDKPPVINELNPSLQGNPVLPISAKPTTDAIPITTTQRTIHIKTNAHSNPPKSQSSGDNAPLQPSSEADNPSLQSNNFAVFHISEDDIPYYPEERIPPSEVVLSVDEIYQPEGILVTQEEIRPVSHYQEPTHLYHQQLPPEYKYEAAPRPIAYGGPVNQAAEPKTGESENVQYSADPQTLIEQGLLPQPVHYVSSKEEADIWMQSQYEQEPKGEERVFAVDSSANVDAVSEISTPDLENPSSASDNFHFKKLPFEFLENQWYHIAFTWSSKDHQVGVYINGELTGTLTNVLSGQNVLEGGGLTILGQTLLPDLTDFDPTSQFIGEISDINLWGQRLGPDAVKALNQCRTDISVSPVLNWQELSMRFYSDVTTHENNILCGA
ncbi:mediator of DNA damage checkpoint protein 1-like [Palaemon carinicauda]|uniref:mediator of DNA damage checkpoint protein 1-like n=1 Tax=Palaemon carinicauda TaxID=392227 RepID=UPI0035B5D737